MLAGGGFGWGAISDKYEASLWFARILLLEWKAWVAISTTSLRVGSQRLADWKYHSDYSSLVVPDEASRLSHTWPEFSPPAT